MALNPVGLPKVHSVPDLVDFDLPNRSNKDSLRPYASPIERSMHNSGDKVSGMTSTSGVGFNFR
jgi:hypothetical protein